MLRHYLATLFLLILVLACDKLPEEPDTELPRITILSPSEGSILTLGGPEIISSIEISAEITDNDQVESVECYVDGRLLGRKTNPPFSWDWNALADTVEKGYHIITIKARDNSGNESQESIQVYIQTAYWVWFWNWDWNYEMRLDLIGSDGSAFHSIGAAPISFSIEKNVVEGIYTFRLYVDYLFIAEGELEVSTSLAFSVSYDESTNSYVYEIDYGSG